MAFLKFESLLSNVFKSYTNTFKSRSIEDFFKAIKESFYFILFTKREQKKDLFLKLK